MGWQENMNKALGGGNSAQTQTQSTPQATSGSAALAAASTGNGWQANMNAALGGKTTKTSATGKNGRTYTGVGQKASGKDRIENQLALATDRHVQTQTESQQKRQAVVDAQKNLDALLKEQEQRKQAEAEARKNESWGDKVKRFFSENKETHGISSQIHQSDEDKAIGEARSALAKAQDDYRLSIDDQVGAKDNISKYTKDYEDKSKKFDDLLEKYNKATTAEEQKAIQPQLVAAYKDALAAENTINDYAAQLDFSGYDEARAEAYGSMNSSQRLAYRFGNMAKGTVAGIQGDLITSADQAVNRLFETLDTAATRLTRAEQSAVDLAAELGVAKPLTEKEWFALNRDQTARLEKSGIESLEEFNNALKSANEKLETREQLGNREGRFNDFLGRYDLTAMSGNAEQLKNTQREKMATAQYGLTNSVTDKIIGFTLETLPSGIEMAFDGVVGKMLGFKQAGLVPMAARVFGSAYDEAMREEGADRDRATVYALVRAAIEVGTELIGGEAIMNRFAYGAKGLLNDPIEAIVSRVKPGILQKLTYTALSGASEGLEEVVAELLDPLAEGLKYTDYWKAVADAQGEKTASDYARAAAGGVFVSLIGGGAVDLVSGTANAIAGNGFQTQTGNRLYEINRNRAIETNPTLANQYQQNVASGMSEDAARANVTKRYDMGEAIYAEYSKNRTAQQMVEDTAAFAKANKNGNLTSAQEGQLLLDMDDKELGRVAEANANGIVIEYNDGSTEAVVFNGNQGLLDAGSKLADYIDQGAEIADAEYSTGKAEMEEPAAAPAPQRTQVQNGADVFDNTQYRVEQTADGKFVVYDANGNAIGGTYDTYADAIGLVDQLSQNSTPSESPQNASQSVSQEEGNSVPPNEQNASETQNEKLNSKPKAETGIRYKQDLNGYTIQASKENPTLDMRIDNSPAPNTTAVGGTVSAETVQDALMGKTVSEGAADYEGTLSEKQVAKLSPVQVIQRLQNYAKKARTSIKGLLKHITSDESGEALIGREAYTKQLIESSVGETRGMNAQGEYEDEVDVIGGEDDTRKERPKRSVEEAQEEVNDINRSNLMTIGDSIRDAMKAANIGRYRSGIDGICDWILDKGRQRRGDAPTQAEYESFRDLVKKMLNDEYHRQNNYKKDKKGNLVDINWKKFNTAKVLDLIDTALAGEADVDALNDADFTEINALLERAANIRIGYGETKNSRLGDVYSGYMDLRSILEGDEAFQEDLNSEIYDGTNLTAGEKWITDEDGNEIKVSDEEGWRENSKEQDRRFGWYDRGDATDGMTQAERDEYEESYWAQNGERDIANMWQQKSEQTGKGNSVVEEYLPSTSPRLSKKPGVDLPTSISGVTVTQEANELSNAAIELISKKLREMGDLQQAINRNAQDIADIKANPSGNAVVDNAKIKQHERMIESLQKRLAPYETWASKIEGQYTINDLLNDSFLTEVEKEAFKAQLDKDARFGRIDLQTIALNNRIDSTTYYLQVGDGMFRQLLDTKTNTQLKAIVEQHEQNIKNLQRRIADNKEYVKSLNPINKALIDKYNKAIEAAENRLAREQEWLRKATGKAGSYTLNDYFADPFIRQYYANEVKGIDTETKENGVPVFGNYQFNGLRNAKSWDFANDLIKDIKKGVLSGELSEHGFNSRGEAGRSLNGERLGLGETTITEQNVYDNGGYFGEQPTTDEQRREAVRDRNARRSAQGDKGTDGLLSGTQGRDRSESGSPRIRTEPNAREQAKQKYQANQRTEAERYNNSKVVKGVQITDETGKPTRSATAKDLGEGTFLEGDVTDRVIDTSGGNSADTINDAFEELGIVVNGFNGNLWHRHGVFSIVGDMFVPRSRDGHTTRTFGFTVKGRALIENITGSNRDSAIRTARHEAQHNINDRMFLGTDHDARLVDFAKRLIKDAGLDYDKVTDRISTRLMLLGGTEVDVADEVLARIADGEGFGKNRITAEQATELYRLLTDSEYWKQATYRMSNLQNMFKEGFLEGGKQDVKPLQTINSSSTVQEDAKRNALVWREGNTPEGRVKGENLRFADSAPTGTDYNAMPYQYRGENLHGTTREGDVGLKAPATDAQERATSGSNLGYRYRQEFDPYSDESFDALVNDTSYEEASAINGQNFDEYTTETFEDQVAAEQASETALMNEVSGREVDTTSATAEDFAREEAASEAELTEELSGNDVEAQSAESLGDLYNAEQQTENEALEDISGEGVDTDNAGAFDDLFEQENRSVDDVLDELSGEGIDTENDELGERFERLVGYQNEDDFIAGRKADYERAGKKPTGEDIYSSEKHPEHWERMQEADRRMNRLGRRSIGDAARMDKITGNSKVGKAVVEAFKDIRTIQKEVMSGSRTLTEFYHTLSSHANERGISQIVDSRIINLAKTAAQLERVAYATESETDKALASAAASRLFGALANNAERVNRIQYEQMYKLVKASEANGKGNSKNPFIKKMQWYNRMQISGGNFWRMIDGYNRGNGIGYNWKDRHELALNRQIKTQAEALSYFADIKADKGYYDFASGKARGKVDSMLNEVTLKMMLDSLAREDRNGNLHFDEVIKQKGFTFEDAKGNQRFVPIEGNTIREKTNFIRNLYDTVSEDIENNSAAKAYRDAASAMFYSFKGKLESTYEALNGYSKQFYEEGKYFPVRYNDNPTAAKAESDTWTFRNVKGRTGTAGKVYRIMPASAVVDSYISQASNYVAFSEIGADLNLLNNGQGAFGSLSDTVGKNFGKTYGDWFTKYVKDMNMLREPDLTGVNKVIEKQRQLMMQGALLFSTSVPIKQTASYFSAMGTLDPVAVMEAWRPVVRASGGKDIKNPFMQARMQGSAIDPDVSAFLKTDWVSRLRNKGGVLGKIVDMTNVMDSRTVANVWKATLIDVKRTSGLSASQLFVKQDGKFTGELTPMGEFLVSTKFENAVLNTQPIFTKQARAEIARTDNMALKLLSTFRTQQTQNYNLMLTAMEEYRADKRAGRATDASGKRLRQTMEGQVLAAASLAALSMIADVMKHSLKKYKDDDDKDKFDPMKMLDRFNKNFAETAAGNWLFVGDLAKLGIDFATGAWNDPYASKEFYGFSAGPINTYMSIINSAKNVWKDINEDNGKHFASNMRYLVGNIATARGIPLNNAYTVANSLVQYIGDAAGWDRHNYEDLLRTWDYNRTNYSQHLYEAVKAGNKDKADKAIEGLEQNLYDNQTLEQRLKGIGRTWLKDGEDPEYVIDYLIDYAGMEEEDASKYVYRAMMEVETGHNFYNMQEDLAKGEYTVEEAAKYLQKYAGYDEKFSNIVANEYLFANEYPDHTYEDITDMYANGELDLDTATDWLVRTSWQTESYARQNLEDARLFKLWDYEPYARTDNSMNDTYATGEKTGLRNFWNQYQDRFKSPKVFGSIFKDIDSYKKSKDYGNYTYVWDGVETQAGNEASAIIESLNKHIANGDITYDTARLIWTQHYARKTSKSGLWKWVKAA